MMTNEIIVVVVRRKIFKKKFMVFQSSAFREKNKVDTLVQDFKLPEVSCNGKNRYEETHLLSTLK